MKIDSLDELGSAFSEWREQKRHPREAVPDELIARAQRAVAKHGARAVVRVTRVERARLFRSRQGRKPAPAATNGERAAPVPAFSRLDLTAPPTPGPRPLAEIETAAGVKLRVFEETREMMGLLSAICGCGETR